MSSAPIGVAMSGGVDSTACALLLRQDHQIRGFLMDIGQPGFGEQHRRLTALTQQLGIELQVVDLKEKFAKMVLGYFSASYCSGMTPNPCMVCNRAIKFGLFMEHILAAGCSRVATGHYARLSRIDNEPALLRGCDRTKDQSYFLARLRPHQLERARFPLGSMHKADTYRLVEAHGFTEFRGQESQDVCFLQDTSVASFLAAHHPEAARPGPIVTVDGERIGSHNGLLRYTIGQRRGIGLPHHRPWYVTAMDPTTNTLIVGEAEDLLQHTLRARHANWLSSARPRRGDRLWAKLRSTHGGAEAVIETIDEDTFSLRFDQAQRAVAPGQFAVLYDRERVVGSGEIALPPATAQEKI